MLATQSIEARHGKKVAQACTIGLPINEDLKLEKGKEKKSLLDVLYGYLVTYWV